MSRFRGAASIRFELIELAKTVAEREGKESGKRKEAARKCLELNSDGSGYVPAKEKRMREKETYG